MWAFWWLQRCTTAIGSFYLIEKSPLVVDGVTFYKDETEALNAHRAVIYDLGKLDDQKLQEYLKMNCKLMLCPTASWEIDRLTDFVRENIYNRKIGYLLYPVPAKYGKELVHNMQRGGCNAWMLSYNPDPFQQFRQLAGLSEGSCRNCKQLVIICR